MRGGDPILDALLPGELRGPHRAGFHDLLPATDWRADSYLWEDDANVWCSLLIARRPGAGAFRRLVAAIHASGRRAVVPTPVGNMPAILRHMGFTDVTAVERRPAETWAKAPGQVAR